MARQQDIEAQSFMSHRDHCGEQYDVTSNGVEPLLTAVLESYGRRRSLSKDIDDPSQSCSHVLVLSDSGALSTGAPGPW
jgi:hypothetical protein